MKIRSLFVLLAVCILVFLKVYSADAIIYGKRGDDEATIPWAAGIRHWELEPGAQAKVVEDVLELKSEGNTGLFFNYPDVNPDELTDYEIEVAARKIGDNSKNIHLFARTVVPTKDFYFVEISYNTNTVAMYEFADGIAREITTGGRAGRPKRPDSKDTEDGEPYIFAFSVEGNILKYSAEGRLTLVVKDNKWAKGPPGIGGRGGQVNYYWVRVDSLPEQGLQNIPSTDKQLSAENEETLATIWDTLRDNGQLAADFGVRYAFSKTPIRLDDTFTFDIRAEDVANLAKWQFDIAFDPTILEAIDVTEGDFLRTGSTATFFQGGTIDNAKGRITDLIAARISTQGVSGTGTLLQVRFKAIAVGETELMLQKFEFSSTTGDVIPAGPLQVRVVVEEPRILGDVNGDGRASILDLVLVAQQFGNRVSVGSPVDVNGDGVVNILDLISVAQGIAGSLGAPPAEIESVDPVTIEGWIAQIRAADDGSLAFKQGIENLENLLASLIPEETALLSNFPNPFNPETWIPYQLATPAEVVVTIYDMDGQLVRRLPLGHRAAGIYKSRSRALHWDGRNQHGEAVASGIYFYTLTAGEFTETRRMLILK